MSTRAIALTLWWFSAALGLSPASGLAQQGATLSGVVVDARSRQPLVGARVHIPGNGVSAFTNNAGRFALADCPLGDVVVRAERIGYRMIEVTVPLRAGSERVLDLQMTEAVLNLDEVVVTGTPGETQRRAIGNTIEVLGVAKLAEEAPALSVQQLLGQRASGVIVRPSPGMVGTGGGITVRGAASMSLGNHPLIYVDGIRVDNNPTAGPNIRQGRAVSRLNDINPEDIASVQIIKGPAAATLYGTEASSGVIQIITKKGSLGAPSLEVAIRRGVSFMPNPQGRLPYTYYYNPTTGITDSLNVYQVEKDAGRDIFTNGPIQSYNANVRGGTDLVRYYVSADVDDQTGILSYNWMKRLNTHANLDISPGGAWDISVNLGVLRSKTRFGQAVSGYDIWAALVWARPDLLDTPTRGFRYLTPEAAATLETYLAYDRHTTGLQLNFRPFSWMTQRLKVGFDWGNEVNSMLIPRVPEGDVNFFGARGVGDKDVETRASLYSTVDYAASATFQVGPNLGLTSSAGVQYYVKQLGTSTAHGTNFPIPSVTTVAAASQTTGSEDFIENKTLGVYVQQEFDWRRRAFLTAALRADDNSAFGADFDVAIYPKLSATWVLSDAGWSPDWLNTLRFRSAWGKAGKQPDVFAAVTLYTPTTGPGDVPMLTPGSLGDAGLKPEKSEEFEIGFEAGLWDDRLILTFTNFSRVTKDAILTQTVRPSFGFPGSRFVNAGRVKGWGNELGVNASLIRGTRLGLDLSGNFATHKNRIESIGGLPPSGSIREGYPIQSVFAKRVVHAEWGPGPALINVLCDGGPENNNAEMPCATAPLVYFGQPNPTWSGNVGSTIQLLGNLRIVGLVEFQGGHTYGSGDFDAGHTTFSNTKAVNYPLTEIDPILQAYRTVVDRIPSGLYDAGFAKLRELSATYSLPLKWTRHFGSSRASLTAAWRNVATLWQAQRDIWGGKIFEVEVNSPGDSPSARWQTVLPMNSQFLVTLRVTF